MKFKTEQKNFIEMFFLIAFYLIFRKSCTFFVHFCIYCMNKFSAFLKLKNQSYCSPILVAVIEKFSFSKTLKIPCRCIAYIEAFKKSWMTACDVLRKYCDHPLETPKHTQRPIPASHPFTVPSIFHNVFCLPCNFLLTDWLCSDWLLLVNWMFRHSEFSETKDKQKNRDWKHFKLNTPHFTFAHRNLELFVFILYNAAHKIKERLIYRLYIEGRIPPCFSQGNHIAVAQIPFYSRNVVPFWTHNFAMFCVLLATKKNTLAKKSFVTIWIWKFEIWRSFETKHM